MNRQATHSPTPPPARPTGINAQAEPDDQLLSVRPTAAHRQTRPERPLRESNALDGRPVVEMLLPEPLARTTWAYYRGVPTELAPFDLAALKTSAASFRNDLSKRQIPELHGVTDGKKVGTYVEVAFNQYLAERFDYDQGNAAKGVDFPELGVDLKVTSVKQPQSSCPFEDAKQKVYGLGYHLLVFVYDKTDDPTTNTAQLEILQVIFVDEKSTADFQTTTGLLKILDAGGDDAGVIDDLDAFIQERNLPLDEIGRRVLAEQVKENPPTIGCLTISNAQQWRLQYGRAIALADAGKTPGVESLRAE